MSPSSSSFTTTSATGGCSDDGVKPGRILFEVDGVSTQVAREALTLAGAKLPVKTRFVQRISE